MANIQNIPLPEKLRDSNPKINQNFQNLNIELTGHIISKTAHKAEDITYTGEVPGDDVKEAIDNVNGRISEIVAQAGDDNTEIVDARGGYPVLGARLNASDNELEKKANKRWFDVNDYGAKGDGVTDDTLSIQSALNAARDAGGGLVFFPGRNYMITSPLTIYSNTTLMGNGRHYSSLLVTGFTDFALNCSQSNIQIKNLGVVTNDAGVKGIKSKNINNLMFSNLYFMGCHIAFDLDGGHTFQISDILIEGHPTLSNAAAKSIFHCSTDGDYIYDVDISSYQIRNIGNGVQTPAITFHRAVTSYLARFHVNDLSSGPVGADGILFLDDCQGCKVISSIIIRPRNYGVAFEQITTPPSFTELIGVDVDQSLGDGIRIFQGNWLTIQSGVITTCQNHGIVMNYNNNKIQGVTIHGISQQGIQVGADVSNFQISDSRIENCNGAAILVSGGNSNNYIINGNNCAIGNSIKIADNGTGTNKQVVNNI